MVTGDFPPMPKGIGDYSYHLSKELSQMGVPVRVITTHAELPQDSQAEIDYGMDVRRIISIWSLKEVNKIFECIINEIHNSYTVVNIQYYCPDTYGRRPMINLLPFILRLRFSNVRVVVTIHGFWEQSLFFRLRTIPMLRSAHGIIYVDRQNQKLLSQYSGLPDSHLQFIPISANILPVDCTLKLRDEWRKSIKIESADMVVGFFGAIGQPKGFIYLIESIKMLREEYKYPLILLAIGGFHSYGENDAYQTEIKRIIEDSSVKSWVRIIQEPDHKGCSQWLHCCDMAVFPFIKGVSENSGSTLAALFHELPVVVTEGPKQSRNFYKDLEVPVITSENVAELAEAMLNVLKSSEKQKTLKQAARRLKSRLGWDNIAKQTMAFYEALF